MAYPVSHMLTVFGGSLYLNEQWSVSLRSTGNFGDSNEFGPGAVVGVAQVIEAWFQSQTSIGTPARLGFVKHNRIGTNGRYTNSITGEVFYEPEVVRTSLGSSHPPQVAHVVTLETGFTRGLAHRGRMFLPAPANGPQTDGRVTAAYATSVATDVASLLTSLNAVEGFGEVVVASDVREGAIRTVTGVSCGRVLDTVRTRRAQLEEERPPTILVGGL